MAVTIHTSALLVIPAGSLFLCLCFHQKRITAIRFLMGLLCAAVIIVVNSSFGHVCREGDPFTQWFVPAACSTFVIPLVRSRVLATVAGLLLFVGSLVLSFNYVSLVHRDEYTGNPAWVEKMNNVVNENARRSIIEQLESDQGIGDTVFPEGWLGNVIPAARKFPAEDFRRSRVSRYWHTWLTGLFRVTRLRADLWYPGGRLADSLEKIEVRVRGL